MKIEDFRGKKITVMGLGLHGGGVGTVRFLSSLGAKILVTDMKTKAELEKSLEKLKDLKGIEYVLGQHRPEDFSNVWMVVKNPGVPWSNKYVKMALDKKISVEVDASIFFKLCKNPIIGITGTKGKTTTSELIYEILKTAEKNPVKVGIGQIDVLEKLKDIKKDNIIVFELSSWRLSALGRYNLSPKIAVITNFFPDHLNHYSSLEAYLRDKKYILQNQNPDNFCVLNWDDETLRKMEPEIKSQLIKFSKNKIENGKAAYVNNGSIFINNGIDEKKTLDLAEIKLKGEHNISNILASVGTALALGINVSSIKKAIASFSGIQHRLELVREISGVEYYNDTAATTPESAMASLQSFSKPIILIAGGSDKKLDMDQLAKFILEKTKKVIFLGGTATDKIILQLNNLSPGQSFEVFDSMEKTVDRARELAVSGDVVLLSPGAASFGMFVNEFDRGDRFKSAVKNLKNN